MISAIDIGFLYTKSIINGNKIIMKSVVGDHKTGRFDDLNLNLKEETDNIKVRLGSERYFVSDLAIDKSDYVYHSLKENRFDEFATEALVHASFGLGLRASGLVSEHYIVSGLPVSHYKKYNEDISNLFLSGDTKRHNYEVESSGKLFKGTAHVVKGEFIPQPFGALLDRVLDNKGQIADRELALKTVAVIDPGFGTSDVYVADALSPVEKLTFSTKTAMNHAYRLISNKIEEEFGVNLPLHDVERITRQGVFRYKGRKYNMEQAISWAYKATANQLLSEVTNKWKDIHEIDYILLAGGGGNALSRWILPEFPNIELLKDSQYSIVNGYYKWGVRKFG